MLCLGDVTELWNADTHVGVGEGACVWCTTYPRQAPGDVGFRS